VFVSSSSTAWSIILLMYTLVQPFCVFLDVNECALGTDNCHDNGTCDNTNGSFACTCNGGYSGDGITCEGRLSILAINILYKNCYTLVSNLTNNFSAIVLAHKLSVTFVRPSTCTV
jgi:hypothetical protein